MAEPKPITAEELATARAVLTERQLIAWRLHRQGMSYDDMRWYLRVSKQRCQQLYARAEQKIEEAMHA